MLNADKSLSLRLGKPRGEKLIDALVTITVESNKPIKKSDLLNHLFDNHLETSIAELIEKLKAQNTGIHIEKGLEA